MPITMKPLPFLSRSDGEYFWSLVAIGTESECWPWRGQVNNGAGRLKLRNRTMIASRLAYAFANGADPYPWLVCHKCDNPSCCNPAHLFLGSPKDNMQDMLAKGRYRPLRGDQHGLRRNPERAARGERAGGAKLTETQVAEIRARYQPGGVTQDQLAEEYRVTRRTIGMIVRGERWAHLPVPEGISYKMRQVQHGSRNGSAKLDEQAVAAIRVAHRGGVPAKEIAVQHGVSVRTVEKIASGQAWRHVPD